MKRLRILLLLLSFGTLSLLKAESLDPLLLQAIISKTTPVLGMNEEELREMARGNSWYDSDPSSYDEDALRLRLTDYGLDLAKIKSDPVISSLEIWNLISVEDKSKILFDKEDYTLLPLDESTETFVYMFDLQVVLGQHPFNKWTERLSEEQLDKIKKHLNEQSPKIVEKLKKTAPLDLEYSGYYPGMDDENVPLGTIGDWHLLSLRPVTLKDGSTLAHEVTIKHDGFMRWGDDQVFNPNIADHYATLEEAIAAGGTESDVCWSYSVIFDSDLENLIYMDELPFWCGF